MISSVYANSLLDKSSVVFAYPQWLEQQQPNTSLYYRYQADMVMWGFTPPTYESFYNSLITESMATYRSAVASHQRQGIRWVARVEWDVTWDGMRKQFPSSYSTAFVRRLDGSPMAIPWFRGEYFFSNHSPLFQQYLRWQIEAVALAGIDASAHPAGLLFDSQHATPAQFPAGGDFSDSCMNHFRRWLSANYSTAALAALGVEDINNFNYAEFLKGRGWTVDEYETQVQTEPAGIPMADLFQRFLQQANMRLQQEMAEFADQTALRKGYPDQSSNGPIDIGTSAPLLDPHWRGLRFVDNEHIDFYVQEFAHNATNSELSSEVVLLFKLAEQLAKPLVLTALPFPDWDYVASQSDSSDLVRTWISQAYAHGALFMVPENMWAYSGPRQNYYQPSPGDYDRLYRWIKRNRILFDGYDAVAEIVLLFNYSAYKNSKYRQLDIFDAVDELIDRNMPFRIVVAGEGEWPNMLQNPEQLALVSKAHTVIVTDVSGHPLPDIQQSELDALGKKVIQWSEKRSLDQVIASKIHLDIDRVSVIPRQKDPARYPHAAKVLHLLNRDYQPRNGTIKAKQEFTLAIDERLFNTALISALYHQPGHPPRHLQLQKLNGRIFVKVPSLQEWGIIELIPAGSN